MKAASSKQTVVKQQPRYEHRVVQHIGKAGPTRKIYATGNKCYSLGVVIPSTMAKTLSLKSGHILRFSIESNKKLIVEKVHYSNKRLVKDQDGDWVWVSKTEPDATRKETCKGGTRLRKGKNLTEMFGGVFE